MSYFGETNEPAIKAALEGKGWRLSKHLAGEVGKTYVAINHTLNATLLPKGLVARRPGPLNKRRVRQIEWKWTGQ